MSTQFSRGIEIITATLIRNKKGEILFIKSDKWKKWVVPGGHVEPGETIAAAAEREAKEETGLETKFSSVLEFQELINSPNFYRSAHFISFVSILDVIGDEIVKPDLREVTEYKWWLPTHTLDEEDLDNGIKKVITHYIQANRSS